LSKYSTSNKTTAEHGRVGFVPGEEFVNAFGLVVTLARSASEHGRMVWRSEQPVLTFEVWPRGLPICASGLCYAGNYSKQAQSGL